MKIKPLKITVFLTVKFLRCLFCLSILRLKAWNRVGHSEASFARLTTPPVPHLWKRPWRIIVPWLSTVNSSTAPGPSPGEHHPDDFGIDIQGIIWACVVEGMGAAWFVLSWGWWLLRHSLSAVNTFVVLAGISTNLMVRENVICGSSFKQSYESLGYCM